MCYRLRASKTLDTAQQETLKKFERNYADLTTTFIEFVQSTVTEMREAEEKFHKDMSDAALHFADKFSKGEVENALDYPDDIHAVRLCDWPDMH